MAARDELRRNVAAFQSAPIQYMAWLRGVALRRHLGEFTGLSQARLAHPQQKLRARRQQQILEHSKTVLRTNLTDSGLSDADVEATISNLRDLREGGGQCWSEFWMSLDYPMTPELTTCVRGATQLDKLLATVLQTIDDNNPRQARAAFADFVMEWSVPHDLMGGSRPGLASADWEDVDTWEKVSGLADTVLMAAFFDQFAHVDAVWGNAFFTRFQARPVFPFIAPQARKDGGVNMPVRRLLEFSWAVNHWVRYRSWPTKRPGPKDLSEPLDLEPSDISNLFDGTTQLRFEQFEHRWNRLAQHFHLPQKVAYPLPLVAVAICWQRNLVTVTLEHKVRSFIVLGDDYEKLWRWRRSTLVAPSAGTEVWAAWLHN